MNHQLAVESLAATRCYDARDLIPDYLIVFIEFTEAISGILSKHRRSPYIV